MRSKGRVVKARSRGVKVRAKCRGWCWAKGEG
jgi:hypothetical protein